MSDERIKEIPGFPNYWCDQSGNIYSTKPLNGRGTSSGTARQLKLKKTKNGYLQIQLYRNGKSHWLGVHALILMTWHSLKRPGNEVNHINGIKTDNRLKNLEWCTKVENERHKINILGKHVRGERHVLSKLTEQNVKDIRALRKSGETIPSLSKKFGIGLSHVQRIVTNKVWKHV